MRPTWLDETSAAAAGYWRPSRSSTHCLCCTLQGLQAGKGKAGRGAHFKAANRWPAKAVATSDDEGKHLLQT